MLHFGKIFFASPDQPGYVFFLSMRILAYVDPGSGQLVWQMVVAAMVGVLFYLRKVRTFLWGLVTKLFKRD